MTRPRLGPGAADGGQFSSAPRAEADLTLAEDGITAPGFDRASVLARVPLTLPAVERLGHDPDPGIRIAVASNPHLAPRALHRLARHLDPAVRLTVANNRTTARRTLRRLARDHDRRVRAAALRRMPA